ncbi:hypothetical protein HN51_064712 [Arachis hypogaea]
MTGWDDINSLKDKLQTHPLLGDPSRVLLLACHGSMASTEQVMFIVIGWKEASKNSCHILVCDLIQDIKVLYSSPLKLIEGKYGIKNGFFLLASGNNFFFQDYLIVEGEIF